MIDLRIVAKDGAKIPGYAYDGDAGLDLSVNEDVWIRSGETVKAGTGLLMAIPYGYYGKIVMRSGFSNRNGIVLANGEGVIDCKYRGEVMLPLHKLMEPSAMTVHIPRGERVAQLIIQEIPRVNVVAVDRLDETERGVGGFGSSGRY